MIYVTHDQIEALTFADRVVVMHDGSVVQVGTPVELFNRPRHTFVGYFIGSPGMNVLSCGLENGQPVFANNLLSSGYPADADLSGKLEIGIRPEFVSFCDDGIPVAIEKIEDLGRYQVVTVSHENEQIKMLIGEDEAIPTESPMIRFDPDNLHLYHNDWIVETADA
jgi:glycerol transport system ATP-binding protein